MAQLKRMDQIRLIISTYLEVRSYRATARRVGMSRNTIRDYLVKLKGSSTDLKDALSQSDEVLIALVRSPVSQADSEREQVFNDQVDDWLKELRRVGVTRRLLWQEYRRDHADGFGYTQFCERL